MPERDVKASASQRKGDGRMRLDGITPVAKSQAIIRRYHRWASWISRKLDEKSQPRSRAAIRLHFEAYESATRLSALPCVPSSDIGITWKPRIQLVVKIDQNLRRLPRRERFRHSHLSTIASAERYPPLEHAQ